jgi:hypothetical protein
MALVKSTIHRFLLLEVKIYHPSGTSTRKFRSQRFFLGIPEKFWAF